MNEPLRSTGRVDGSPWYVLCGNRHHEVKYDRREFHGVRWFHRDRVPLHRADPSLGRFLHKLYRVPAAP